MSKNDLRHLLGHTPPTHLRNLLTILGNRLPNIREEVYERT